MWLLVLASCSCPAHTSHKPPHLAPKLLARTDPVPLALPAVARARGVPPGDAAAHARAALPGAQVGLVQGGAGESGGAWPGPSTYGALDPASTAWVHALHPAPELPCVPVKRAALPGPAVRPAVALSARRLFNLGMAAPQHSASGSHVGQDLVTVLVMERKDCSLAAHLDLKEVRGEGRAGRRGAGRARWGLGGGRVRTRQCQRRAATPIPLHYQGLRCLATLPSRLHFIAVNAPGPWLPFYPPLALASSRC